MSKRILLLSTRSSGGGAAEATRRLFFALRDVGVEVRILTLYGDQGSEDDDISSVYHGHLGRTKALYNKALERLDIIRSNGYCLAPLWRYSSASRGVDISSHPWVEWADILHIHWVNQGFLSISSIHQLQKLSKPIFWTLHDLWAVTGGCHIPFRFEYNRASLCPELSEGCKTCPLLQTHANKRGLSHSLCKDKRALHALEQPIHYIAVSRHEASLFNQSYLRRGLEPCSVIAPPMPRLLPPNEMVHVEIEDYSPQKDYILVVAARLDDEVKGFTLLKECLLHLHELSSKSEVKIELLLVGDIKDRSLLNDIHLRTHHLGRRTASELAYIYSELASLTLSSSLYETFGQSLTESLGYGTPVIAFKAGGPEDIVKPGINGYLAEPYNTKQMAELSLSLLQAKRQQGLFSHESCRSSVEVFSPAAIAKAHCVLYHQFSSTTD